MSRTLTAANKPPLGTLIATRLIEMGESQKWLSEKACLQPVYLCAIIAGRVTPSIKMLKKISQSIDVDVKDLAVALLSENRK